MENTVKKPELLMPAGSLPVLKVAVMYGADAVYIGGEAFSLRAGAANFSADEMREGIEFAHARGVKVYVTVNVFAHNEDIEAAKDYLKSLNDMRPDALIISDPGIFDLAREILPETDIHISTQANNSNYGTYNFWARMGAKRVVSAREMSIEELKELKKRIPEGLEIETFVHGAMCISYSGRCLLSAYMTGRSANLGACTHPCRWKYALVEETRPGQYMPVEENERGTYIFNSKDLCMIEHIPELVDAGIDSFKVEGRMKSALYVASVGRTYRMAIDDWFKDPELYESRKDFYREEISKCTYREYTTGFFFGKPDETAQISDANTYVKEWQYLGMVGNEERISGDSVYYALEQKNKFCVGDEVEIMSPSGENFIATVRDMSDEEGTHIDSCPHPKQKIFVYLGEELEKYDIIRAFIG